MLRSRCESHHRNGITDLNPLQRTSATKSATTGHHGASLRELLVLRGFGKVRLEGDDHVSN
jgi:hypothetical protein